MPAPAPWPPPARSPAEPPRASSARRLDACSRSPRPTRSYGPPRTSSSSRPSLRTPRTRSPPSRRIYNGNVQSYNTKIQVFPNSLLAALAFHAARVLRDRRPRRARAGRGRCARLTSGGRCQRSGTESRAAERWTASSSARSIGSSSRFAESAWRWSWMTTAPPGLNRAAQNVEQPPVGLEAVARLRTRRRSARRRGPGTAPLPRPAGRAGSRR